MAVLLRPRPRLQPVRLSKSQNSVLPMRTPRRISAAAPRSLPRGPPPQRPAPLQPQLSPPRPPLGGQPRIPTGAPAAGFQPQYRPQPPRGYSPSAYVPPPPLS